MGFEDLPPFAWQGKDGSWGTRGQNSRVSKLTEEQVYEIKRASRAEGSPSDTEIGKLYGVTRTVVSNIRTGKRWGHVRVDDPPSSGSEAGS